MTTRCRRGGRYCWKHSKHHGQYNRDSVSSRIARWVIRLLLR